MGILTKEVEVRLWSRHVKHYLDLGYYGKHGDIILVKVNDLPNNSKIKVEVKCDYCGIVKQIAYADYLNSVKKYGEYNCNKCMHRTITEVYKTYGVENYSSTNECKLKVKDSLLKHYGYDNCAKIIEIQNKIKTTNLQRYGYENPMQSPEVKAKANETLCKNGTQKTSKQQFYLHSLYGGEINYPISYYATDICFPEEKIYCEYSGGGHSLRVTLGSLTQEEFDHKEIIRNNVLRKEGYRKMEIISLNDKLPSDTILLQMLDISKNYFNTTQHSWITFDIDQSLMFNAENKDGVYFDFGELRTIKKEDISDVA